MTYSYTKNREKQEEKIWTKTRKQHRGRKAQTPKCDGSKSPSFSLCSFLTTTVNAQILDSCSTRIRKEKNNCQDKLNASLTDRTFTFIHETTTATVSKHGAFTVRWMLLDHRSQTAQHHLTCFFSHFPPPRLLHHILRDDKSPGLCLIRPKDTLEYYRNHPTFILCNCSLLNACCFCRDWYFTFTLISCRSISALRSSTYRTLWTIITVKSQHLLPLGWWLW